MHILELLFLLFILWFLTFPQADARKVTQAASKRDSKPDKSWARSMIDSAKQKYHHAKDTVKEKYHHAKDTVKEKIRHRATVKTTVRHPPHLNYPNNPGVKHPGYRLENYWNWRATTQRHIQTTMSSTLKTTKKSIFLRAKEKAKEGQYVQKAVGFVKKDLGIGVEGPKKPSKIIKYGKKAVEWVFKKKTDIIPSGSADLPTSDLNSKFSSVAVASKFHDQVQYIQDQVSMMQNEIQESWNTSEAGTKYKLFEEPKSWNDAQTHCEQLGSNLAFLDSQSKNEYATSLLQYSNISHAWFGLHTDVETAPSGSKVFHSFSNSNGCGVVDENGAWSINTCSLELPFICQAIRLNVYVDIPLNEELQLS